MRHGDGGSPTSTRSTSSSTSLSSASAPRGEQARDRWLRRARTLVPPLVLLGILVSLVANCARALTNTDTYFHLRFGEEFLGGWSLQHPGSVSTFATRDWVPTQWLSEIVMARTEQWFGLAGLAWLSGLLEVLLFLGLYVAVRSRAEPLVAMPLTGLGLYAMQSGLSMRPQVVSYLLVVVVVAAWLRTLDDGRSRWWLVPLAWLWATLHGMWPVALLVGAAATLGLLLDHRPRPVVLRSAAVTAACAVAVALTPVGPSLYGAVLTVSSRTRYFAEWQPPDWSGWTSLGFLVLLAVTLAALWLRRGNTWTETLLVALGAAFGAYAERTVPVGAALLAPLAAAPLQSLLGHRRPMVARERRLVAGASLAALVVLGLTVPRTSADPIPVPEWADSSLDRLPAGTKVLNDWNLGGYLMWRYPRLDLMMHGYGDTFTTAELDRNTRLLMVERGWQADVLASGARWALLRPDSLLSSQLVVSERWRVVRRSDDLILLHAPASWGSPEPAVARPFPSAG